MKPSERIAEIANKIGGDKDEVCMGTIQLAIVKFLDEQYEEGNK